MYTSGRHPFDYGVVPGDSNWPSSLLVQSHDKESQYWLSSERNDEVVKRRIVDGDVDFPDDIWENVSDGMISRRGHIEADKSHAYQLETSVNGCSRQTLKLAQRFTTL